MHVYDDGLTARAEQLRETMRRGYREVNLPDAFTEMRQKLEDILDQERGWPPHPTTTARFPDVRAQSPEVARLISSTGSRSLPAHVAEQESKRRHWCPRAHRRHRCRAGPHVAASPARPESPCPHAHRPGLRSRRA